MKVIFEIEEVSQASCLTCPRFSQQPAGSLRFGHLVKVGGSESYQVNIGGIAIDDEEETVTDAG